MINDIKSFDITFEDMAQRFKDICWYNNGEVFYYRDKNELKVDAIIHLDNEQLAVFEIKPCDQDRIAEGAKNLLIYLI